MRKPRTDELWDRTPGGVIVPRRVGLPTRRFIQKWGQVPCCCEEEEEGVPCCPGETLPLSMTVDLSGILSDGTCDCSSLSSEFVVTYDESVPGWLYVGESTGCVRLQILLTANCNMFGGGAYGGMAITAVVTLFFGSGSSEQASGSTAFYYDNALPHYSCWENLLDAGGGASFLIPIRGPFYPYFNTFITLCHGPLQFNLGVTV